MTPTTMPVVEALQLGGYLLLQGLITKDQLDTALAEQKRRPFLHLGEVLCLTGALDPAKLAEVLTGYHREARLGSILVAKGLISLEQLADALALQLSDARPLGEILVSRGGLSPQDLDAALAQQDARMVESADLFAKCEQYDGFRGEASRGTNPFFKAIQAGESALTRIQDREFIMLAANSYLGMSTDPEVIRASMTATEAYGVGTSGSPLLNGTMDLHERLERDLASFMRKEACALFSTGFQTNLGAIAGLVGRGDVVIADSLAHASIFDGCKLSFGEVKRFNHNNMAHLEQILKQAGNRGKLIVIDGVYSMDGDMADLPNIVRLAKTYGAKILLDDAHGFGVFGAHGRGTAEFFGLEDEVDLIMLTFSKSLGTIGGCILGDEKVIRFLKWHSRPFIFSATLPPGTAAATHAALGRIASDPSLRQRLAENVEFMRNGLLERGFRLGATCSQILPVLVGDEAIALEMGNALFEEGILVATVVSPGVPAGQARLRISMMATHTPEILQRALDAFERIGRRLGVIGLEKEIPSTSHEAAV